MKTERLQTVHRPVARRGLLLQAEDPFLARDHISLGSFTSQTFLQAWQAATEEAATDKSVTSGTDTPRGHTSRLNISPPETKKLNYQDTRSKLEASGSPLTGYFVGCTTGPPQWKWLFISLINAILRSTSQPSPDALVYSLLSSWHSAGALLIYCTCANSGAIVSSEYAGKATRAPDGASDGWEMKCGFIFRSIFPPRQLLCAVFPRVVWNVCTKSQILEGQNVLNWMKCNPTCLFNEVSWI